jgi:hypothetical protein
MRCLALVCLLAGTAFGAETRRIGRDALADLLWSSAQACDGRPDDLTRRQCRALRAARLTAAAADTYTIAVDDGAVWVGAPDAHGVVSYGLRGCLACAHALGEIAVVTHGSVRLDGDAILGPDLWTGQAQAVDLARLKRLQAQVTFRIPRDGAAAWTQGGRRGYYVEPVGYRLWDPCDGTIVAADPAAGPKERGEVSACGGGPDGTAGPTPLPEQPTSEEVKAAMDEAGKEAAACFDRYGVPGTADLWLEVAGQDGAVKNAEVHGELADTPTAKCVQAAAMKAKFPRFQRATMQIHYPFILR